MFGNVGGYLLNILVEDFETNVMPNLILIGS